MSLVLSCTGYREHYIRDAQGNTMAVYRYHNPTGNGVSLRLRERPVYGSSRVANYTQHKQMYGLDLLATSTEYQSPVVPMVDAFKEYELTDHLGNVTAVVTGQLLPGGNGSMWQPRLLSAQGYEPFGSLLPGRNYSSGSYRHLFQGQEHDDELYGSVGTSYAFEYRMHDPRVGRFLSIDPLAAKYPYNSPYAFSENRVIDGFEYEGLEFVDADKAVVNIRCYALVWDMKNISGSGLHARIVRSGNQIANNYTRSPLPSVMKEDGVSWALDRSKSMGQKPPPGVNPRSIPIDDIIGKSIGLHDVITTARIEMKLDEQMIHIHSAYAMFEKARMDGLVPDEIYNEECASIDLINVFYRGTVPDTFHELEYSDKNGSRVLLTGENYRREIEILGRTIWHSYEGEYDGPIGLPQVDDHCDESNSTLECK